MPQVTIHGHSITNFCMMTVHAGTNCPQGGDSGHGGRTVFRLFDDGATVMEASVNGRPLEEASRIEIVLGGDAEADCFFEALEFAIATYRNQRFGRGGGSIEEIA